MKLPISRRLLACADLVPRGSRVADIGCDHGYLSIHLLTAGIAASCIASDINEGPLLSAIHNARKFSVKDRITFCLSDGVRNIPRDFDTMVCAGMGGDTMIHILHSAPWLQSNRYTLVLQCQSKTPMLRRYLSDSGWRIAAENVLRDGRFLYTVMQVLWDPEAPKLDSGAEYFPDCLLARQEEAVADYFRWVAEGLRIATAHQDDAGKQQALDRLEKLYQSPDLHFLREENL